MLASVAHEIIMLNLASMLSYTTIKLQDELRICVLPGHLSYDSAWPVRKIPLRMTPYEIAYDPENKVTN